MPLFVFFFDLGFFAASLLPRPQPLPDKQVDLIAVLTGGQGRIREGLSLLEQDRGQWLLISGVEPQLHLADVLKANRGEKFPVRLESRIILGRESTSTFQNAVEVRESLEQMGGHSLILVTSSYHQNRALKLLEREFARLPKMNVEIFPSPTESPNFPRSGWWWSPTSWSILLWEYVKSLPMRLGFE